MKRLGALLAAAALLAACAPGPPRPATSPLTPTPRAGPTAGPAAALGPGGLTLAQEVGAVMMVGFQGAPDAALLSDWRARQFGGLLIVNLNHNANDAASMRAVIAAVRGTMTHRLLAATDQEGGFICLAVASVPCLPMPVGEAATERMAAALADLGFDLDLGPVSDVCSGTASIMWGRCYGTDPGAVAAAVGPVVDGIHAAHLLAAAKHFPGHGDTAVSSETTLPVIDSSRATVEARNLPPFRAAVGQGADFVMIGHLDYPALDPAAAADVSPLVIGLLRSDLGFGGAVISDDMEMGSVTQRMSTPEAAVRFLLAGGDMVMVAHHLAVADATYDAILAAVESGRLPRSRLDSAVASLEALRSG